MSDTVPMGLDPAFAPTQPMTYGPPVIIRHPEPRPRVSWARVGGGVVVACLVLVLLA